MKLEQFLNEMSGDFDFPEEDFVDTKKNKMSAFSTKDDTKLKNGVRVFETLKAKFDNQTARKILASWKESGQENFKDYLLSLINDVKNS